MVDEFVDNPLNLGLLAALLVSLAAYGYIAWRRKKVAQAKFQDSVLGAAAAGGAGGAVAGEPTLGGPAAGAGKGSRGSASQAAAGMAAEEVDPIAEADVYMAYGRDTQAEEILKEVLQKDPNRVAVHAKLLEIYANRRDAKSFEQTALKLKGLTNGTGPEWEKAAALGRSIDPQNGVYGGAGAAVAAAPAVPAAAAAPTLDFDLGGGGGAAQASPSAPDISLDAAPKEAAPPALDFDISGAGKGKDAEVTVATGSPQQEKSATNIHFNLDLGATQQLSKAAAPAAPPAPASDPSGGLDFDLNLDAGAGGEKKSEPQKPPAAMDLSSISLDLGSPGEAPAAPAGSDPKWQEVATKLDLAKAYEEMGDKDGARELLNEVMKDGDAAQKGTAQQLLAKLG
jgi:pilus assembly protein FimV